MFTEVVFLRHSESFDPDNILIRFEENQFVDQDNGLPAGVIDHLKAQAAVDEERRIKRFSSPVLPRSGIVLG